MSIVIGLSGPQGAGKSSLLKELGARGYYVDDFKVSRKVQADLGWDNLDRVMDNPYAMMDFQNKVFEQKLERDLKNKERRPEYVLTERSFADISAYTTLWTWKFEFDKRLKAYEVLEFLADYTSKCVRAQQEVYGGTILLPWMDHIQFEQDFHRAKYTDIRLFYTKLLEFMQARDLQCHNILTISAASVEDRADQVDNFLKGV